MIFSQLLYIYQSEHYDKLRFIQFVYSHLNWFSLSKRGKIDWTLRAKIIMTFALLLFIFSIYFTFNYAEKIIYCFAEFVLIPFYILIADILISPLVLYKKNNILKQAKNLINKINNKNSEFLKIGITGSYGKTTIKTVLYSLLQEKYNIFLVPGNINTDLGIANYLLKNKKDLEKSDILLLEMGAFHIGEIESICNFIQPNYSFLTAIGNQHLERFGSHGNIKKAKFEIVTATTQKAFVNISDKNITNYLDIFNKQKNKQEIISMDINNYENSENIKNINYLPEFSGISFEYKYKNKYIKCETKLIANHIISSIYFCLKLTEILNLSAENIQKGIKNLNHVPHRLEILKNKQTGVTVIDDSYNGNFDGFISALKTLDRASGRKIVLTPGIVELGKDTKKIHENLASIYPSYVDVLLLIKNQNTKIIKNNINLNLNIKNNIKIIEYDTVDQAHADLINVLKKGDTILFQNDLSDNY